MRPLLVLLTLLLFASAASAQPFTLDAESRITSHWFDGADVLVTSERGGVHLRHRSGRLRVLPASRVAVAGFGQGEDLQLVAMGRRHIYRLKDGVWSAMLRDTREAPKRIVVSPSGEAIVWNETVEWLVHVSAANVVTPVTLPPQHKVVEVFLSPAGEFVLVVAVMTFSRHIPPSNVLMRLSSGTLVPHESDALVLAELSCHNPRGGALLGDGSMLLYARDHLCHIPAGVSPAAISVVSTDTLFGERNLHSIQAIATAGEQVVLLDTGGALLSWRVGDAAATQIADSGVTGAREFWVDPVAGAVTILETMDHPALVHTPLLSAQRNAGQAQRPPSDGSWLASIEVNDEVQRGANGELGQTHSTRGLHMMLPIGRLNFGALATLSDGPGAFAFDIAGGVRFQFWLAKWHPVFAAEFGYSRRGGVLDTHDLLLTLAGGMSSTLIGVQLAESIVFAVGENPLGENRRGLGLRSAIRIMTFADTLGVEIAHGMEFNSGRHELRFTAQVDLAQLIMIGTLLRRMR